MIQKNISRETHWIYLFTRILDTPLWAVYNMLPFILYKSMQATPFQIALVIAMKPAVSILSMYWSARVNARPDRLVSNILLARALGCLPFLLFFFRPNIWWVIFSAALYMTMAVGALPAWMELLKCNMGEKEKKTTFAYGSAFGYLGGGILPIGIGYWLDNKPEAWNIIFSLAAAFALLSFLFQRKLQVAKEKSAGLPAPTLSLLEPWKNAVKLLKGDPQFLSYQIAFMVMGSGLMILQPALPVYFIDRLGMSYVELGVALALCKGVSYAIASPLWAKWLNRVDIFRFTATITAIAALFPLLLLAAGMQLFWVYIAYCVYGLMQAGSEMSWNMSGPIFSKEKDSSLYTSVNIVSIGLRGCLVPAMGGYLCTLIGASTLLSFGACLFLIASYLFLAFRKAEEKVLT